MEGKLCNQFVSILIDPSSNYKYVSKEIVEKCNLAHKLRVEKWLVQLAMGTKKKVSHWVELCVTELQYMLVIVHLNMLSLGAYDVLLVIDWLHKHHTKVDCYEKAIECLDEVKRKKTL